MYIHSKIKCNINANSGYSSPQIVATNYVHIHLYTHANATNTHAHTTPNTHTLKYTTHACLRTTHSDTHTHWWRKQLKVRGAT